MDYRKATIVCGARMGTPGPAPDQIRRSGRKVRIEGLTEARARA